jgi:mersacidin/lichenicidin family type 2 lantibiotic
MTADQIVRSWKNEDYRLSLSLDEQALLPQDPAGMIELADEELLGIAGGSNSQLACSNECTMSACTCMPPCTTNTMTVLSFLVCPPSGG